MSDLFNVTTQVCIHVEQEDCDDKWQSLAVTHLWVVASPRYLAPHLTIMHVHTYIEYAFRTLNRFSCPMP